MMEKSAFAVPAVGGISEPDRIRVVIFANNQMMQAPLNELVAHLLARIEDLEARVTTLENP